eukprot:1150395-Pelagomonas_calceolata.AAC.2
MSSGGKTAAEEAAWRLSPSYATGHNSASFSGSIPTEDYSVHEGGQGHRQYQPALCTTPGWTSRGTMSLAQHFGRKQTQHPPPARLLPNGANNERMSQQYPQHTSGKWA